MQWTLPPGWKGRLSSSQKRWFYWQESNPTVQTWTAPSWVEVVAANYSVCTKADAESGLFRSCQNFCKTVLLNEWLFRGADIKAVVDIGCGKGGDLAKLPWDRLECYVGVDASAGALEEAERRSSSMKERDKMTWILQDANSLSLPPNSFDAGFSNFALHYAAAHLDKTLISISKTLKPGARFLFTTLDPKLFARHRDGFGPLKLVSWESRDSGRAEDASLQVFVQISGTLQHPIPEYVITDDQLAAACKASHFLVERTSLLGEALAFLDDWAATEEEQSCRERWTRFRDERYPLWRAWDSTHYEFANCYKAYLLKKE